MYSPRTREQRRRETVWFRGPGGKRFVGKIVVRRGPCRVGLLHGPHDHSRKR